MTRYRADESPKVSGSVTYYGNTTNVQRGPEAFSHRVWDEPGVADGQPFTVRHYWNDGGHIANGILNGRTYSNYVLEAFGTCFDSYSKDLVTLSDRPPLGALAAELLAKTSPNAPSIDTLVFLKELPEIVDVLKYLSRLSLPTVNPFEALRRLSGGVLTWKFGIKPLVNDLLTIISMEEQVQKKYEELEKLKRSGLRRKRTLFTYGTGGSRKITASSMFANTIRANGLGHSSMKVWGFVKWYPSGSFKRTTSQETLDKAKQIVFGLNVDLATAWEAMPWSWLIDWASSFGDVLRASRHGVPVSHSTPQIMTTTSTEWKWTYTRDVSDIDLPQVTKRWRLSKLREVSPAYITAYMPFLSGGQVAILGSLLVLRDENLKRVARAG